MNEKLANTLIDLGVEINTYQDGDAFVKTYQFNDAQLLAFREEAYQAGLRRAMEEVKIMLWEEPSNYPTPPGQEAVYGVLEKLLTALSEEIKK